jgi:hypothetical protein
MPGLLLIRRSPLGKITAYGDTAYSSVEHAALAAKGSLIGSGVAGSRNARLFGDALGRRPVGTVWGHPSGYDFRILEAHHTSDRALITPSLRVLDYDRRWGVVEPTQFMDEGIMAPGGQYFDGWYYIHCDGDDQPYKKFNGERLATKEPKL